MGRTTVQFRARNARAIIDAASTAAKEALEDITNDIVKASSGAAPHDEGTLEKSWSKEVTKQNGKLVGQVQYAVRGENGYNYAVKMHEQQYNLGAKSVGKSGTGMSGAAYPVGSHFLTRPFNGEMPTYKKHIEKKLKVKLDSIN
ncbi:HK97 gp10 family phage protein [Bacillus thuringiensis]|uniref:HK97 gp10 family phage protein n=1 Tax=Bacillus thuringiensis TaxID=1428 RepID=UPI000BFCC53E|nr:HK97 gp10 family phage protein [Bacillus thuringiensis]PGM50810.1 hypothetical protein CN949_16085 [Bacillus thuringiensis]